MFDYDARPVTRQVLLIGRWASTAGYNLRDFLSRNGIPYNWIEVDDTERVRHILDPSDVTPDRLPVCVFPDGSHLSSATVEAVAHGLGLVSAPALSEYDLAIVGAGPAGLAAGVYAASEGLRTVAVEAIAPGGQAGTTSMIENYLGFPQGISGSELAGRATAQARRFGAEILLARRLVDITRGDAGYLARLSDGTQLRCRALLITTGVDWRHLDVPGLDELLGAGVYYGAGPSEALSCHGGRVAVVGGGNSAGQAVVRFSRYASQVTLLIRGATLGSSMSQYLATQVSELDNVDVRTHTEVVGFDADTRLRGLVLSDGGSALTRLPMDALFVCIGGVPRTAGLEAIGLATDEAGFLRTGVIDTASLGAARRWSLSSSATATRNEPPRALRRRRRPERLDQALLRRHRRRIDGSGTRPPTPRRDRG